MQSLTVDMSSSSKLNRVDIQWSVKRWHLFDNSEIIKSDSFQLYQGSNYLKLKSIDETSKELVVSLHYCAEHQTATAKVFLLDKNQEQEKHKFVCNPKTEMSEFVWTEFNRTRREYRQTFNVNETVLNKSNEDLVFFIELTYLTNQNEDSYEISRYCVVNKLQRLILDDYSRINECQESMLQDHITFLIGSEKLKAHTLVLGATSSYFSAMFRHKDFKENKERTVDLTNDDDVTSENFQIFLDILYGCKKIQDVETNLLTQLCILADKYNVKELVEACEFLLSRTITKNNVNELLVFAQKYNCEFLKSKAIIFAKDNINDIKKMPTFDNVYKIQPLLLELL